jgi:phage-related protein
MTLPTFTPPIRQTSTSVKDEFKILSAEFGDGYTQETPDGLNSVRKVASLKWDSLTESQADAIENALRGYGGANPFYYTLRGDTQRKWKCKDVSRTYDSLNTVSAEFREYFGALS